MKIFKAFSVLAVLSIAFFSCKNDQEDFGPMKGINYFSRNDAFGGEQVSFENADGISNHLLKKQTIITISSNCFTNEDGSAFTGKVVLSCKEDLVRGFMALNCVPTVSDGNPLSSEGAIYLNAVDIYGHKLKIASGKNIEIAMPGSAVPNQNRLYYGEDNVKDPSPENTSLFNWKEFSSDTVEYYFDNAAAKYYYKLNCTELGWISCGRMVSVVNPVGIKVRVKGIYPMYASNTAVYVVPVSGESAFRLWNYDAAEFMYSLDKPYLSQGSQVYIIVIASVRKFKIFYSRELITIGANTTETVEAVQSNLNSIASNLYYL